MLQTLLQESQGEKAKEGRRKDAMESILQVHEGQWFTEARL